MSVDLTKLERKAAPVLLALTEVPGETSAVEIQKVKECLSAVRKWMDQEASLVVAVNAGKQAIEVSQSLEERVLHGAVALIEASGRRGLVPSTMIDDDITVYRTEIAGAARKLGKSGEWLAELVEKTGEKRQSLIDKIRRETQALKDVQRSEQASAHLFDGILSQAVAFIHVNAEPGSKAHQHLKRKYVRKKDKPQASAPEANPSAPNEEPAASSAK